MPRLSHRRAEASPSARTPTAGPRRAAGRRVGRNCPVFFGQVDQNCAGFGQCDRGSAIGRSIDPPGAGMRGVGVYGRMSDSGVLLTLRHVAAGIERNGEPHLLQRDQYLEDHRATAPCTDPT